MASEATSHDPGTPSAHRSEALAMIARHVLRHPELGTALPEATYAAARMRIAGLVVISGVVS